MAVRFDPTVNLGHILTFVGFIIAGLGAYGIVDKRVSILEEARHVQTSIDRKQDDERSDMKQDIRDDIKGINAKLDRLLQVQQVRSDIR